MLISNMVPEFLYQPQLSLSDSKSSDDVADQANKKMDHDPTFAGVCSSNESQLRTQWDLNDIVRDLNLSKSKVHFKL